MIKITSLSWPYHTYNVDVLNRGYFTNTTPSERRREYLEYLNILFKGGVSLSEKKRLGRR